MLRPSLEISGSRYYTNNHHGPPPTPHSLDSRGESPLHHNSAAQESPYSSLNGALRPADSPPYHHHDPRASDSLLYPAQRRRRLPSPSGFKPDRSMNSRQRRSHSPYPVLGHMPEPSSSQRPDLRLRTVSNTGAPYGSHHHQDSPSSAHYAGGEATHMYAQQPYDPETMPYGNPQASYPSPGKLVSTIRLAGVLILVLWHADGDRFSHPRARQRELENVPTLAGRGFRQPTTLQQQLNYREVNLFN